MTLFSLLFLACLRHAAAGVPVSLSPIADTVAGGTGFSPGCFGANCLLVIVIWTYGWLQPIFAVVAAFLLVWGGFTLVNSQEEEKLQKAKKMVGASIAALMLLYLPFHFVTAFYGLGAGAGPIYAPFTAAAVITTEIAGIVLWFETFVAVLAVTVIVVSGILAVTSYGKEEGVVQFKHTVGAVIFGVFLIVVKQVILLTFGLQAGPALPGAPSVVFALVKIVQIVNALLGFVGLLAVGIIVYAGIMMALNFGNEEQYSHAKGIIFRAAIGLLAIIASLAVIRFVMTIA